MAAMRWLEGGHCFGVLRLFFAALQFVVWGDE